MCHLVLAVLAGANSIREVPCDKAEAGAGTFE